LAAAASGRGTIRHEARTQAHEKNLLASGEVPLSILIAVVRKGRGGGYSEAPHHQAPGVVVHIIRCTAFGIDWYVKWYVLEPDVWFISVHH
jgi:hypothetical protein